MVYTKNDDVTQKLNLLSRNGAYSMVQYFLEVKKKYQYPSHAVLKERCLLVYWFLLESVLIYTIKFVDLYYIMCLFELAKIAKTTCFPYYIKIGMGLKSNEYCVLLHTKHYDIQPLVRWQRFKLSFCFNDIKCV